MGKSFKRNQQFRPKKQGKIFTKDQPWKKHKHKVVEEDLNYPSLPISIEEYDEEDNNI